MTSISVSRLCSFRNLNTVRKFSTKVVSTNDESTFIAWHPKKDFPYECTKPLPTETQLQGENTSVLKTQLTPELLSVLKKKSPDEARQELMDITHTTKHRWFPKSKSRTAENIPMDRQYL